MGQELVQLRSLQCVDAREHVCEVCHRVNVVAFARPDEGQMDGHGTTASVGADEQEVFSRKNKILDRPLSTVVVDFKIGVSEKASEGHPVLEGVLHGLHQRVLRIERASYLAQSPVELARKWFGFSSSNRKSIRRWLPAYFAFHCVELLVDIDNFFRQVKVSPARMSIAPHLRFRSVFEKSIESVGGIGLDKSRVVLEELFVSSKRLIGREHKDIDRMFSIAATNGHFAFAHGAPSLSILNLDGTVICLNDLGCEYFTLEALVQWLKSERTGLKPIAQGRPWDDGIFAEVLFCLAVVRQTICTLVDNSTSKQAWTSPCAREGRARLFGGDQVFLALRACAFFLFVSQALDRMQKLFELVRDITADSDGVDRASWANRAFWANEVRHRNCFQVLIVYVLLVIALFRRLGLGQIAGVRGARRWSRVGALGGWSVVLPVLLLSLFEQLVELGLKIGQQGAQVGVAHSGVLQLLVKQIHRRLQGAQCAPQFSVLLAEPFNFTVA